MRQLRSTLIVTLTAAAVLGSFAAHAATVSLEDTYVTVGPGGPVNPVPLPPLTLLSGGELTITLTPVAFGAPLSALSFELVDGHGTLLAQMSGNGGSSLADALSVGAGTYYALSFGKTGGAAGAGSIGFYGLTVSYTPVATVPLPGSAVLLASALAALGLAGRLGRPADAAGRARSFTPAGQRC